MSDYNPVVPTNSKNNLQALYSFLRVLAVALSVAILPHFVAGQNGDPVVWKELLFALGAAAVLTVANYFRSGEVRFGVNTPNVERA